MPTAMLRPRQRPSWMPDWLDTFLSDPSTTLATTNIQTAPAAAAQAVARPLLRAILPKLQERAMLLPEKAKRLEQLVGRDMTGALLKTYPRATSRLGNIGVMNIPGARGAHGRYGLREDPTRNAFPDAMGAVVLELDRARADAPEILQHLVGHEAYGHGPQDLLGILKRYVTETDAARRGEFLPEWITKTLQRFNMTPYWRRQAVPDIAQRTKTLTDVPQIFYESAPTELAANTRSFKLRDLARQQMLERTGEPYIPGLGPRENITKVNQWRKDYVTNRLRQFDPVNSMVEQVPAMRASEQDLLDYLYRMTGGNFKQPSLFGAK